MIYRQLGKSGLTVSLVSLGCNNFGDSPINAPNGTVYGVMNLEQTRAVVDAAFDSGVTLFDTADVYGRGGSERFLGEILKDRRREVVIATKWGSGMDGKSDIAWGSRRYIRQAVEASLRRLQTDYIDLYQMHWPDPRTPFEETLAALDELVKDGKVRYIGSSHLTGWQIADTDWLARSLGVERFVCAQNHYSLLQRSAEAELLSACERFGVGLLPYFPLENGLLTGKYRRNASTPPGTRLGGREISSGTYDLIDALDNFAKERGRSMLDIAIGALAAKPAVSSVITGATKAEQIKANAVATGWVATSADLDILEKILAVNRESSH